MRHMLVEGFVFVFRHFRFRASPQGTGLIDGFVFARRLHGLGLFVPLFLGHADRQRDVIRVLAQNLAQLPAVEQIFLFGAQVQNDFRTATRMFDIGNGVITLAG